jgi:SOS-response transcriptional repressor LexA
LGVLLEKKCALPVATAADTFPQRLLDLISRRADGKVSRFAGMTDGVVSEALIRKYLTRESLPGLEKLESLAATGGVSVAWLIGQEEMPSAEPAAGIPVVSRIRAGLMSLYEVERYAEETIPVSEALIARPGERLFGLRVEGDSMSSYILPGDVVICSTVRTVEVGDDVAYYRQSTGESTVKRLDALDRKTGRARLRPLNPEYDPFTVQVERGDQLALVVAVFRETKRQRRTPDFQ